MKLDFLIDIEEQLLAKAKNKTFQWQLHDYYLYYRTQIRTLSCNEHNYAAPRAWVSVWIKRWTRKFVKQIQNRQNILDAYLLWFRVLLFFPHVIVIFTYSKRCHAMRLNHTCHLSLHTRWNGYAFNFLVDLNVNVGARALVRSFTHFRLCMCIWFGFQVRLSVSK